MTYIGELGSQRACLAFCDYLKVKNLTFRVDERHDSGLITYTIYAPEQDAQEVELAFNNFISNPNREEYLNASWQLAEPAQPSANQSLGLSNIWSSVGFFTRLIAGLCILIFVLSYLGWYREVFFALKFDWLWTEPYRLITPAIMHLSAVHLLFNLAWWWYLGGRVEKTLGYQTLIQVFLISALASNVLQVLLVNDQFAGLSGVNYALAGFVWVCGTVHKSTRLYLPNNLFVFLIVWMLVGFVDVLPIPMANWAHLGGLLAGMLLGLLLVKRSVKTV